jgi:hypothetical protein
VDGAGDVLIADDLNNRIREVTGRSRSMVGSAADKDGYGREEPGQAS